MSTILDQDIAYLAGVGPRRKEILQKELGIATFGDLLEYFPYKYVDRSRVYRISELSADMPFVQLMGRILSFEEFSMGARKKRVVAHFSDGHGVCDLVWFNGARYIYDNYKVGREYVVFGKPGIYGQRFQISHPDIDDADKLQLSEMGMQPYYVTTERMKKAGITSRQMERLTKTLLSKITVPLPETLPPFITERLHLVSRDQAMRLVHYPRNAEQTQQARLRLKFEELFYVQMNILRYASQQRKKYRGYVFQRVGELFHWFYDHNLPFSLTGAQKRVMHEIRADMCSGRQMNRLLQGDVGSGKTLVALMSMLIAADNGFQACLTAPTEILAEQHLQTLREFLRGMDVSVELLTGTVKGRRRQQVLDGLVRGEVHILVGTHAIIEDGVQFQRLGLAVIDEQHRFGVAQRAKLWGKSDYPPHVLVMTATPIPRMYVVFPLIKESERTDLKNLEEGFETLCQVFPEYRLSKVHGRMKAKEKEEEMQKFVSGETQILVSTTVIEVGVNVPNASVMVILDAQRFGLSQLHQLRGRVGRGAEQSYCILVTNHKLSRETAKRIDIMCDTNDGFRIAEADLKLRGPGDLEGTQQSGMAFDLKIADLAHDGQLLQMARDEAQAIVDNDPLCSKAEYQMVWNRLKALRKSNVNWAAIS